MSEKITQTAGREQLGKFAPMFAHLNDDVLFGEVWNEEAIDVKTKCIITVVTLMASGITDSSLEYHLINAKKSWCDKGRDCRNRYPCRYVLRMAERMGSIQTGTECLDRRIREVRRFYSQTMTKTQIGSVIRDLKWMHVF